MPNLRSMKTFHHAVTICQKLGLKYIWIDSLCIIQDSQDDWYEQASRMSEVYKYSQCTITATAADDDTVGCFFDRDSDTCLPTRVEIAQNLTHFSGAIDIKNLILEPNPKSEESEFRDLRRLYDIHGRSTWVYDTDFPVNSRAWIVQERFLSPRVLHFANKQLFWECTELHASESYPFGMSRHGIFSLTKAEDVFKYQNRYPIDDTFEAETQSQKCSRLESAFRCWCCAIDAYTSGNLTKASDKLVAISAIAREMKPLMRSRYLAGLWEVNLVPQLAWFCLGGTSRSTVYRAPSWSWASIDGSIFQSFGWKFGADVYYPLIDILEVVTDTVSKDELGQVKGGHIKLLGQIIDLEIIVIESERYYDSSPWTILVNGKATKLCLNEDDHDMRITTPTKKFCCLPLDIHQVEKPWFNGLVLECLDVTNNVYRRTGLLSPKQYLFSRLTDEQFFNDPLISAIMGIEKTKDDVLAFKRESSILKEIVIV
ncbi:hypothetical protein OCU04_008249 [Sclerotinia nivalis]|uniref:Heterokaryon incompatibility domain-containing protein n=1 Tax=Sclerotinia nivalis TaxID=352851 RepID=A0A9X0DHG1_9HELO|nr:hypothetical protein OCU04_008249 [Sclerotinia nivalis]